MQSIFLRVAVLILLGGNFSPARALDRTNEVFKIFQFSADQIPQTLRYLESVSW